jgi:hypothetical protein
VWSYLLRVPRGDHRQKFPCLLSRNRIIAALLLYFLVTAATTDLFLREVRTEEKCRRGDVGCPFLLAESWFLLGEGINLAKKGAQAA